MLAALLVRVYGLSFPVSLLLHSHSRRHSNSERVESSWRNINTALTPLPVLSFLPIAFFLSFFFYLELWYSSWKAVLEVLWSCGGDGPIGGKEQLWPRINAELEGCWRSNGGTIGQHCNLKSL
ncbi:hypothetical protein RJT34_16176 [Clitoria ternatea]|uniref:Uncharacterized protein n=1 Tax=Clitoria ternatea TaxID=43366 RepID=A0AAN9PC33_CLITE